MAAGRLRWVRERGMSPGWLAAGVAVGVILAPVAAVAAGAGVTSLVGPNGTKAAVARTGQLLTNPADVNSIRIFTNLDSLQAGGTSTGCVPLYIVPAGDSLVLTQLTIDTWVDPTPGTSNNVIFWTGTSGTKCMNPIGDVNPPTFGDTVLPFSPGYVVPAGDDVAGIAGGGVSAEVYAMGYLVPVADAPHLTGVAGGLARVGRSHQ